MVQVTYPGVYIQEVSSGVHTITSVGTSITAFIDFFREGPMNEAIEIFGMADFQRIFGGLDDRSEASYAIAQFFLNGGSSAFVVRVAAETRSSPRVATDSPLDKASVGIKSTTGAGAPLITVSAASEGAWGNNVRVDIDLNTTDPTKLFNLTAVRYDTQAKPKPIATEKYLNLSVDKTNPSYFESVINGSSKLITVKHETPNDATTLPAPTGTSSTANIAALTVAQFDALRGKKFHVKIGTGTAAETEAAATFGNWAAGSVTTLRDLRGQIEQAIRSVPPAALKSPASWAGASVELNGSRFRVLSGKNGEAFAPSEVVVISDEAADTTSSATLRFAGAAPDSNNVQQYALGQWNGVLPAPADVAAFKAGVAGGDGLPPDATAIIGSQASVPYTGMYALDRVDLFNILCIPRAVATGVADTQTIAIYSAALAFCELKRAFLLIDVPPTIDEMQEVEDWLDAHATLRNKNAALYFPRTKVPDPVNGFRLRSIAAGGTMAGIYARTDSQRGVWKAPAGIEATLDGVAELDIKLTDAENGVLNPLAINCLRTFPVYGNIAWGSRTLVGADQMASEWKYVPIRRLALMLEESLFRGTKWVVFEPNDEPLWAKIRLNVGAFMNSLFRQGAFQGATPKEAYFVKCDAETTTQDDRNKGIVNIQVGFAPLKPAEFVVISIQQIAGDL
jgi:phage tail sheath protein FI